MHAAKHEGRTTSGEAVTVLDKVLDRSRQGVSHGGVEHKASLSIVAYMIWQSGANSVKLCRG